MIDSDPDWIWWDGGSAVCAWALGVVLGTFVGIVILTLLTYLVTSETEPLRLQFLNRRFRLLRIPLPPHPPSPPLRNRAPHPRKLQAIPSHNKTPRGPVQTRSAPLPKNSEAQEVRLLHPRVPPQARHEAPEGGRGEVPHERRARGVLQEEPGGEAARE